MTSPQLWFDPVNGKLQSGPCKYNFIDYNTNSFNPSTEPEGRVWWNSDDHCPNASSGMGPVLQVGQENWLPYSIGKNDTGDTIPDGTVVYLCESGGIVCIAPANSRDPDIVEKVVGITTDEILDGETGIVTTYGLVRGMDTSEWDVGATVYVSPTNNGELTDIRPTEGDWPIPLCEVIVSDDEDGVLFVKYLQIFDPDDIKNATGFPQQNAAVKQSDVSFTNIDRTLSIAPNTGGGYTSFYIWQLGVKYLFTETQTVQIGVAEGTYWIYFDEGVLTYSYNPSIGDQSILVRDKVLVAMVYWDAENEEAIIIGDERHGHIMSSDTHAYFHFVDGARWLNGLTLNSIIVGQSGDTDSDAQFGVDSGTVTDEDLLNIVGDITSTTGLPIFYLSGANGYLRRNDDEVGFSVLSDNPGSPDDGRLVWNNQNAGGTGVWGLTEVGSNDYVLCHVFATNSKQDPVIAFVGQGDYATRGQARAGATTEISTIQTNYPSPELVPLATVIYRTRDNSNNAVKANTESTEEGEDYVDWRTTELTPGSSPSAHPNLSTLTWLDAGHSSSNLVNEFAGFNTSGIATLFTESDYALIDGSRPFSEVVQQSSTSTGRVTLKDSPGDEARIYWGSDVDEDKYMEMGAYAGVNNIDTKTRDLVILSDAGDIVTFDATTLQSTFDGDIIADKLISDVWESASASTSSIYFQSGTWYIKTNNIDIASFDSTSCMNVYCNLVMNANNITDVGTVFVDSIDLGSQIITDGEMTGDWQLTTSGAELKVGADYFGFNDGIIRAQDWYGFTWTMDDFGGDFTGIYFATGQINFQAVGISIFDFDGGSGGQYHFRVDGDFHGNDIESVGTLSVDFIELVAPIEGDIITIKTRDDGFTGSNTLYLGNDANTGDAYLTVANTGHGESKINQDVRTFGSPTFAGLTVTGGVEFGTLDLTGSPFGGDIVLDVQGTTGPDGFPGQVTAGDSINLICGDGNDCYSTKAGTGGVFTLQFGLGGADLGGGSAGDDGSLIIQTRLATICEITTTLADFQGIDITTTGAITATNYTATSTVHTNTIKDYSGGVTTIDNDTVIVGDLDVSDLIEMAITTSTVGQITQDGIRIFHTFTPDDQVAFWNNIFIGENSGNFSMNNISSATHGTGNVGIGANTLDALTTGFYNFAIGTNAGSGITTGESNVNIGHQAGLQTTTGSSNVLIGRDAGVIGNKTSCVGIGRDTLRNSGSRSVGIGGFAGKDCTGTDNIFLGYAAGYHLTTDIDTLIIGNQFYADRATELSDSIIVGIMDAAKENQTLNLNANVTVSEKLMVDAYDTDEDFSNNLVVVSNADSGGINLRSQRGNTGDYHGIKFRGTSFEPAPNQFYKTGIFHVDNGLSGARGDLYLCVDNASDANNVDLTNVILKIKEGSIDITDAVNMVLGTTTGTQIGTATAQKLSFHGNTPIIQQTTSSQTPATFVANTSGISDDTGTWNGYTIGDLVAILQAYGLLA